MWFLQTFFLAILFGLGLRGFSQEAKQKSIKEGGLSLMKAVQAEEGI